MNHMYIRHTLGGRLFLDSEKHHAPYSINHVNDQWIFTIKLGDKNIAEEILQHRNELNIFMIGEKPNQKSWFYSKDGTVNFDELNSTLTIVADIRMDYTG
jgi:hypothetical protein